RYADSRWPYDKEIASDTWYGLLDEDLVPDLAVGRLPADGKSDALVMVRKIIEYEESRDFGPWRKRVNVIAGTGGFGPMVDAFLEGTFRKYMTELLDPAFDVTLTYGNPRSPYCFPPPRFSEKVVERINAGSLVTAYVGHGSPGRFDSIRWKGRRYPICDGRAVEGIEIENGSPVVVIIACSTGHFDRDGPDCISEKMMALERGPVAVFSSTRISHPYANGVLGRELIVHLMQPVHPTLGEAILAAKKAMLHPKGKEQEIIDRFAGLIMKPETLVPCREDHVHLYNLLGDPAMILAYPRGKAEVHAKDSARFGEKVDVTCRVEAEDAGRWILTLEAKRGVLLKRPAPVKGLSEEDALEAMAGNWKSANDVVVTKATGEVDGPRVEGTLSIPRGAYPDGEYVIKLYAWGDRFAALGHTTIQMTGGEKEEEEDEEEEDGF
ncbi:MAG: C25 family cysteine peptidase, partial [Planctomycetota bacterium]